MIRSTVFVLLASLMLSGISLAQGPEQIAGKADRRRTGQYNTPISYLYRHSTLQHAHGHSQQTGRPLVVFVTSNNCAFCKKMLAETFSHPQIGQAIATYTEPVVLNASQDPKVAKRLGVRAYPTTLVISREGNLLTKVQGFVGPQDFADRVWPVLKQEYVARKARQQPERNVAPGKLVSYRRSE